MYNNASTYGFARHTVAGWSSNVQYKLHEISLASYFYVNGALIITEFGDNERRMPSGVLFPVALYADFRLRQYGF